MGGDARGDRTAAFVPAGRARARVAFGAPLSAGLVAEAELADIVLTEFEPTWRVRECLEARLPPGWQLVDLYDVWLGAPALAGQVVAADYRIEVVGAGVAEVAPAVVALLVADRLPRERQKGTATVTYDLRPLVDTIEAGRSGAAGRGPGPDPVPPGTRHGPAGGGRCGARRPGGDRARRRVGRT